MSYLFACICAVGIFGDSTDVNKEAESKRLLITSEMIRETGITRLHDLFRLADRWDSFSKDGFTWHAGSGPLVAAGGDEWTLFVENHRIKLWLPGGTTLNRLPISSGIIHEVRMDALPSAGEAALDDRGAMRIDLSKPARGWSFMSRGLIGNEAGDPGPFFYTDRATSNVDKTGLDPSLHVGYGGERFSVLASANVQREFPTDPALADKYPDGENLYPRLLVVSSSVLTEVETGRGTHSLLNGFSYFGHFFPREHRNELLPAQSLFFFNGANGSLSVNQTVWSYRLQHNYNQLRPRGSVPRGEFHYAFSDLEAALGWKRSFARTDFKLNSQLNRSVVSPAGDSRNSVTVARLDGSFDAPGAANDRISLGVSVVTSGEATTLRGLIRHRIPVEHSHTLLTHLYGGGRLVAEDLSHWYHYEREGWNEASSGRSFDDRLSSWNIGMAWNWSVTRAMSLETTVSANRQRRPLFNQYISGSTVSDPAYLKEWADGVSGSIALDFSHRIGRDLEHSLYLHKRTPISQNSTYRIAAGHVPGEKARYSVLFRPVRGLSAWLRWSYDGARNWRGVPVPVDERITLENHRIRPTLSMEFALQKYFLDELIRTNLLLRNVFDSDDRHHPRGNRYGPILFLQIELTLPRGTWY